MIPHMCKVFVRRRALVLIPGRTRMINEIPHVLKQVYAQHVGHFNNFDLRVWVINVVAPEPRNNGITRYTFPLYRTSKLDVVVKKQRQIACVSQRDGASATDISTALMPDRFPFELDSVTIRPKIVVHGDFKRTLTNPVD